MLLFENVKLALSSIRSNKMRAFLTMLGIIIGISSVIAITSIGDSARGMVGKEFESFGKNAIFIYINWEMTGDYIENPDMISDDDIEILKGRFPDDLAYAAPSVYHSEECKVGSAKAKVGISGVDSNYDNFKKMNIIHGRMINDSDVDGTRDVMVIDKKAALHFFNTENAVGRTLPFVIKGDARDLTIVGIYEVEESLFSEMGGGGSYAAYAPYTLLSYPEGASQVEAFLSEDSNMESVNDPMLRYLEKLKKKPEGYYMVETAEGQQAMIDQMLGMLSLAIGAIAAISLAVGGIGIMNIMLVSVTERTREIGIRKSLGARTKDILQQFLIEAMILAVIGGLIGTGLGLGIAAIGMKLAGVDLLLNPTVIVIAVVFSALVGMFFGLYPARKAARLDPIEALRYE